MTMTRSEKGMSLALGALAGGIAGFVVWQVVKGQVDAQVTATIDREVPVQVRAAMQQQFQQIGLTPAVAGQIRTLVANLDQLGVFSTLASSTTRRA